MNYAKILLLVILLNGLAKEVIAQDENESSSNEYYIEYLDLESHENKYGITLICVTSNDSFKIGDMQEDLGYFRRELDREKERTQIHKGRAFRFQIKSGFAVGGSGLILVGGGMIATGSKALEKSGYTLIATGAAFVVVSFAI